MSSGNGESKVKTKTVLLASNLYRPNIGGIENSLYHLSLSYQEMGYEVIIFASDISPSNVFFPQYPKMAALEFTDIRSVNTQVYTGTSNIGLTVLSC